MYGTEQLKGCCFLFLQNEKFEVILLVILLFSGITNGAPMQNKTLNLQEIHLVRCLTYISQSYFAPGRSLVISSPATYRDVQQELIVEIHRTAIWPVVVTVGGNISNPNKTDFIDSDGSYIILIPDGNFKTFQAEILGLAAGRGKFLRLWNSEARFVVAGTNEFSMRQQTEIFNYLSQFRIYNCIIVNRENYIIDEYYGRPIVGNDIDKSNKLGVYTWFPYRNSNSCTDVKDIIILDSWVISAQGHFTKNTDLFPGKISNSFNGCPMKAIVRDAHRYFTTNYVNRTDSNGSFVREVVGLEMNLLRVVLQQMNMTFVHVPTPKGFEVEIRSVDNLIKAFIAKDAYIALGEVGIQFLFISSFDSTNTHLTTRTRWYVPCSVKYPRWSSIFRILSVEMWLVLIISIVSATISTTLVGRYSCTSEWQGYKTLTSSLTNIWAVILGVPVSTMPRTPSLRSLFLSWVCFSLAFNTAFQAFLTTFLIDSGYKTPIQNMDELFASGIKLAYTPEFKIFFEGEETEVSKVKRNLLNCSPFELCVDWAVNRRNLAIFLSDAVAEIHYARGYFVGENSEPLMCSLEDGVFYNCALSMVMLHADPLMRRVTHIIDRVVEAGIHKYWVSLCFNWLKIKSRKIAIVSSLDGYYSFNLYHLQPAFYLLLMGWCLSVLSFIVEVLYYRVLSKRKRGLC